jgi:hypothetical protein
MASRAARKGGKMSEEEKRLDNEYADHFKEIIIHLV